MYSLTIENDIRIDAFPKGSVMKEQPIINTNDNKIGALIENNARDRFCTNTQERMGWTAYLQGEEQTANPYIGKIGGHVDEDAWDIGFENAKTAVTRGDYVPTELDKQKPQELPSGDEYVAHLQALLKESSCAEDRKRILRKLELGAT